MINPHGKIIRKSNSLFGFMPTCRHFWKRQARQAHRRAAINLLIKIEFHKNQNYLFLIFFRHFCCWEIRVWQWYVVARWCWIASPIFHFLYLRIDNDTHARTRFWFFKHLPTTINNRYLYRIRTCHPSCTWTSSSKWLSVGRMSCTHCKRRPSSENHSPGRLCFWIDKLCFILMFQECHHICFNLVVIPFKQINNWEKYSGSEFALFFRNLSTLSSSRWSYALNFPEVILFCIPIAIIIKQFPGTVLFSTIFQRSLLILEFARSLCDFIVVSWECQVQNCISYLHSCIDFWISQSNRIFGI